MAWGYLKMAVELIYIVTQWIKSIFTVILAVSFRLIASIHYSKCLNKSRSFVMPNCLTVNGKMLNGSRKFKAFYHKLLIGKNLAYGYGAREILKKENKRRWQRIKKPSELIWKPKLKLLTVTFCTNSKKNLMEKEKFWDAKNSMSVLFSASQLLLLVLKLLKVWKTSLITMWTTLSKSIQT